LGRIRLLFERDGVTCHFCGVALADPESFHVDDLQGELPHDYPTIDHLIPKSKGGTWHLKNTVLACPPCNNRKGDALVAVYPF